MADFAQLSEPLRSAVFGLVREAAQRGVTITAVSTLRTVDEQIALRKAHCGTSTYAIYEMPASQCTPDTAPPGSSQHELGLAVDFDTDDPAALAMIRQLAPRYRLVATVPSEDWHYEHADARSRSARAKELRLALQSGTGTAWRDRFVGGSAAGLTGAGVAATILAGGGDDGPSGWSVLTDTGTWVRVGQVVAGLALGALGGYLVINDLGVA